MSNRQDRVTEVVDALLRYLASHPDAADTVDGIAEWWLPRGARAERGIVEAALERLLAQGIVRRQTNTDQHVLYLAQRRPRAR